MLELVWIALACVVTAMALGFLWWGVLFTKPWMRAMGWEGLSKDELKQKEGSAGPGYMVSVVAAVVGGLALWFVFDLSPDAWERFSKPGYGVFLGVIFWAAFYVPSTATTVFFESRDWRLWAIDVGYRVVVFALWGLWVGLLHV